MEKRLRGEGCFPHCCRAALTPDSLQYIMSYNKNKKRNCESSAQHEPRLVGEILHDYLENSNEQMPVAYCEHHDVVEGWHANTDLGCNVKTLLRSDKRAKVGKSYPGVLRLDSDTIVDEYLSRDPHYTFTEAVAQAVGKRNPHIFDGKLISVTRRDDGRLRLNFKQLEIGADFKVERFALGVYNEICMALEGLIKSE